MRKASWAITLTGFGIIGYALYEAGKIEGWWN
jgi:hypothetical protein